MIRYLSAVKKNNLHGTALLRLDFNTADEWRMKATLPTIQFLLKRCDKIVIVSHKGRPQGVDLKFSLRKDAQNLGKLLKKKVVFIPHFRFTEIKSAIQKLPKGSVVVLENLRFLPGEEKNDKKLAKHLASLADFYVNDAFAVSHRDDASVEAITRFLPSYAGLELENEIKHLSHVMGRPKKPLVVIFGGGKAHDKLPVVKYFKTKADIFLLGGAVANAILQEQGVDIKKSSGGGELGAVTKEIARYKNIVLPVDFHTADEKILDIGPYTLKLFAEKIKTARTIIWNGPLGLIEDKRFQWGTKELAKAIVANKQAFKLTGGGETIDFLNNYGLEKKFNFVSTGGGAMLEFLSGKKLPGIEALKRKR